MRRGSLFWHAQEKGLYIKKNVNVGNKVEILRIRLVNIVFFFHLAFQAKSQIVD